MSSTTMSISYVASLSVRSSLRRGTSSSGSGSSGEMKLALVVQWATVVVMTSGSFPCVPECCPNDLTLLKGQCSVPLIQTEEDSKMPRSLKNCVKEPLPQAFFMPRCDNLKEYPLSEVDIRAYPVTSNLNKFVLKSKAGGTVEESLNQVTFYSKMPKLSLPAMENGVPKNKTEKDNLREKQNVDILMKTFPAMFCVDSSQKKVLSCPKVKLGHTAKVLKCCPFGKELSFPSLTNCSPSELNAAKFWTLRIHGHAFYLQDLIRFPYDYVIHEPDFFSRTLQQCADDAKQLLFDYESFQIDQSGNLVFSRLLHHQDDVLEAGSFCVDLVTVENKYHYIVAMFCSKYPMEPVDDELLTLKPPNGASGLRSAALLPLLPFRFHPNGKPLTFGSSIILFHLAFHYAN